VRRVPVHPLFFGTFPVLFLFTQNATRVRFGKVIAPLAVVLVCVVVMTLIASLALRSLRRGALIGSGFAVLALSYGHVWTAVRDKAMFGLVVGRDMFLLPLWALLGAGIVLFAWRVKALPEVTGIVNAVATGLLVLSLVNTSTAVAGQAETALQASAGERSEPVPSSTGEGTKRDIYYLIFDRYGSAPTLDRYMDFDNSPFVDALTERGFYVANDSRANYPTTSHSLSSSLNMQYLDDLAEDAGADNPDWKPLYRSLIDAAVPHFLRGEGYRYAHIGSWYDPTASDPTAHVNYHYDKTSEFTRVLTETTLLQPVAKRVGLLKEFDGRQVAHKQILFQFDSILDASRLPGPTFVFAHFLLPHDPYTFDENGRYVPLDEERTMTWDDGYKAQTRFANKRILAVVDRLLDVPDEKKPIIVLQADEGPKRLEWKFGGTDGWPQASDDILRQKVGILNAMYLPGGQTDELSQDMTPVNTFRRIFNMYFGTDLEPLPDRVYVYGTNKEPYVLTDITKRVEP
jgi:hypothetical protein